MQCEMKIDGNCKDFRHKYAVPSGNVNWRPIALIFM